MSDLWDAKQYLKYSEERFRPALDLMSRIKQDHTRLIYDLGCGTGHITKLLQERWPNAKVIGVDNSEDMLKQAHEVAPEIKWVKADVAHWQPDHAPDIIFSNAALQWLEHHETLIPKLFSMLAADGVLAIQMPRNFKSPSHLSIIETVEAGPWCKQLSAVLRYGKEKPDPVFQPQFYYQLLAPLAQQIDIWEIEYTSALTGDNPVLEWMMGTGLRPILNALDEPQKQLFIADYSKRIKSYYPKSPNGKTLFPFKRLFIVAK